MIAPLDEIRTANSAMELILNLRTKHAGLQWALEACEMIDGQWRVVYVVFTSSTGIVRYADSWSPKTAPMRMCEGVNDVLAKY